MRYFFLWLSQFNKAFVSLTMFVIYYINTKYGIELPIDETTVILVWGTLASLVTFYVPNTKPEDVK